ncbi:hypothetical protein H3C70_04625 [Patescibacteria group bacterium]|nr:hypothetical protein [Patescibacteria group bacterium]
MPRSIEERTVLPASIIRGSTQGSAMVEYAGLPALQQILHTPQTLDESVADYYFAVERSNFLRLFGENGVSKVLIDYLADRQDVTILVPGSDGKLEKGPFLKGMYSPMEVVVICNEIGTFEETRDSIIDLARDGGLPSTDDRMEHKVLAQPRAPLSGYKGETRHSWPDRILNSKLVFGPAELFEQAQDQVFQEWRSIGDVRSSVKGYLKQFVATTRTGEVTRRGETHRHFDLDTGEIFYDENNYVLGLKYGPIRALQVFLAKYQLETGARAQGETNTVRKLLTLFPGEDEVALAYQMALRIYHWQQFETKNGKPAYVQIKSQELRSITRPILDFIQRKSTKSA